MPPKAIAFYLPQFHRIPENDRWWGEGFTEWRNVQSATPLFPGHYQPHVPLPGLGYYDLSDPRVLVRQHHMALRHQVSAFCYYFYHFKDTTLLEKPLRIIRSTPDIPNEYCLCWANAPWTRAWYGQNKEVLIEQEYSAAHAQRFMEHVLHYLQDPRYIKIENRPLLLVYEPERIPIIKEYSRIWNMVARGNGFDGVYLVAVEALEQGQDPAVYGFQAAVEFAPDWLCTGGMLKKQAGPRQFDYQHTVKQMILKPRSPYPRMRCVFPSWDNTPRYKKASVVFTNTSIGAFKLHCEFARKFTEVHLPQSLQYVFINAWNEWGEGCHLEPDERHGTQYLEVVKEVFSSR
ncbi:glycosyltransferase WbsX family protein [Megalodesulfovibrio paquesii]